MRLKERRNQQIVNKNERKECKQKEVGVEQLIQTEST